MASTSTQRPPENVKDIEVTLPPGLIGNPSATPQCTDEQLFGNACPAASQVGVTTLRLWQGTEQFPIRLPVFNMVPDPGQTADFAFQVIIAPVHIVATLDTDGDYSLTTNISDISELLPLGASELSFWGVPADSVARPAARRLHRDRHRADRHGRRRLPRPSSETATRSTTTPARPAGPGSRS